MSILIVAIGKKHEPWVISGIEKYESRLAKPWNMTWRLLPHSSRDDTAARSEESGRILQQLKPTDHVVLLDERGKNMDSPGLARHLQQCFDTAQPVVLVIGGAYGVTDELRGRANTVWSLSNLVFPHQLVRLIVTEQIYRAQEIAGGKPYHHV